MFVTIVETEGKRTVIASASGLSVAFERNTFSVTFNDNQGPHDMHFELGVVDSITWSRNPPTEQLNATGKNNVTALDSTSKTDKSVGTVKK